VSLPAAFGQTYESGAHIGLDGKSYPGGLYLTDGSMSQVQTAETDAARDNPSSPSIVQIPSGTFNWSSLTGGAGLIISQTGNCLQGTGTMNTSVSSKGAGTSTSVIQLASALASPAGASPMISIQAPNVTIQLLDLLGPADGNGNPPISDSGYQNPHLDNITFDTTDAGAVTGLSNECYQVFFIGVNGLIDHCSLIVGTGTHNGGGSEYFFGRGVSTNWSQPSSYFAGQGPSRQLIFENCSFTGQAKSAIEMDDYGAITVRFSNLNGAMNLDSHGYPTNGARGARWTEWYSNALTPYNSVDPSGYMFRGGGGLVFNNTITSVG